ncbi:uncharacterized protein [Physcomitrium patens]|uniref:uncharacterized protein n=1 Tax=Physcomitrium patens TaxID=3218 RepID=UPI003CCE03F4
MQANSAGNARFGESDTGAGCSPHVTCNLELPLCNCKHGLNRSSRRLGTSWIYLRELSCWTLVGELCFAALEESHRGDIKCGIRAFKTGIGEKRVSGDILNLSSVRNCREWGRGPRKLQPNGSMRKKFWGEICWRGQVIAR